jgi:hypothetical protein
MNRPVYSWCFSVFLIFLLLSAKGMSREALDPQVYVMLGFHASFYHSWRGDTPDEAGFGTDIRIVREIIRMLDEANKQGLEARGYWDFTVHWTLEQIIPEYAPDIIEGIKRRVEADLDEVLPGPYNNGANSAATREEFLCAVGFSFQNQFGSGLDQVFGRVTPIYRPQEGMFTTGQIPLLQETGVEGLILAYSNIPFTSFTNFIPVLEPEHRFNPVWMRTSPDGPRIMVLPCVSPGDVVNFVSMENWLLKLRKLQNSGRVNKDLLIHINFDADAETWLPIGVPGFLAKDVPNAGGLMEYIDAVNKYPWAHFTTPGEYLRDHLPEAEILVRQDLADGAFDGYYSWAEKFASHRIWSELEMSRVYTYQAMALSDQKHGGQRLWEGIDSSFFKRLIGLCTTHFGMSTPIINEERQEVAERIASTARNIAQEELNKAAARLARARAGQVPGKAEYSFTVFNYPRGKDAKPRACSMLMRVPVVLPPGARGWVLKDEQGQKIPCSIVNMDDLSGDEYAAEILFALSLGPREQKTFSLYQEKGSGQNLPRTIRTLKNPWIEISLDEESGIREFLFKGNKVGGKEFLDPFITYRTGKKPVSYHAQGFRLGDLSAETWHGIQRAALHAEIPVETPHGTLVANASYTLTLPDEFPWVIADVRIDYPYTLPQDIIHTVNQKLRRYLDLRWIEVAPFQLSPSILAPQASPLKIWKHNYLDITSFYELNYGQINPENKNLDSFNHHVTAGWVAMSNGRLGFLIGENAQAMSSMAFCPMRLRQEKGIQHLSLNPFGSYHGKQFDYSHLGGNSMGTEITLIGGAHLKPNGPSYNGESESFSLLLAPYPGDEPPGELQADAAAFFYPFGVVYLNTPLGKDTLIPAHVRDYIAARMREKALASQAPLPAPTAFLANPSDRAVDLVWDEPRDLRVAGYEVRYRGADSTQWTNITTQPGHRLHIPDLENDTEYIFQIKALAKNQESEFSALATCRPGPVKIAPMLAMAKHASPALILKYLYYAFYYMLTTP